MASGRDWMAVSQAEQFFSKVLFSVEADHRRAEEKSLGVERVGPAFYVPVTCLRNRTLTKAEPNDLQHQRRQPIKCPQYVQPATSVEHGNEQNAISVERGGALATCSAVGTKLPDRRTTAENTHCRAPSFLHRIRYMSPPVRNHHPTKPCLTV